MVDPATLLSHKGLKEPQKETQYLFSPDAVLLRLRHPHFVFLAANELGQGESKVLELVCALGHCSINDIEKAFGEKHPGERALFHDYFRGLTKVCGWYIETLPLSHTSEGALH